MNWKENEAIWLNLSVTRNIFGEYHWFEIDMRKSSNVGCDGDILHRNHPIFLHT